MDTGKDFSSNGRDNFIIGWNFHQNSVDSLEVRRLVSSSWRPYLLGWRITIIFAPTKKVVWRRHVTPVKTAGFQLLSPKHELSVPSRAGLQAGHGKSNGLKWAVPQFITLNPNFFHCSEFALSNWQGHGLHTKQHTHRTREQMSLLCHAELFHTVHEFV